MSSVTVGTSVFGFFSWWGQELAGLLPVGIRGAGDAQVAQTVIEISPAGWKLIETNGSNTAPRPEGCVSAPAMLAYLASRVRAKQSPGEIALRLPGESCFVRHMELPAAARADYGHILARDLERSTPFKVRDVLTGFDVENGPAIKGMLKVRQFILKRRLIDGPKSDIESLGLKVVRVEGMDAGGVSVLPVNFLAQSFQADGVPKGSHRLAWGLAVCLLVLAGSGIWQYMDRHEQALSALQQGSAKLKAQVQRQKDALIKTQSAFAEIAAFQKLRAETVSRVVILEELTRILPETAWITDLKIEGGMIDISGLAVSAAALVPMLERSKVFVDATSTASLTLDPREDKERFSIRARIRNGAAAPSEVVQ